MKDYLDLLINLPKKAKDAVDKLNKRNRLTEEAIQRELRRNKLRIKK